MTAEYDPLAPLAPIACISHLASSGRYFSPSPSGRDPVVEPPSQLTLVARARPFSGAERGPSGSFSFGRRCAVPCWEETEETEIM